jgi:hypothetical protein
MANKRSKNGHSLQFFAIPCKIALMSCMNSWGGHMLTAFATKKGLLDFLYEPEITEGVLTLCHTGYDRQYAVSTDSDELFSAIAQAHSLTAIDGLYLPPSQALQIPPSIKDLNLYTPDYDDAALAALLNGLLFKEKSQRNAASSVRLLVLQGGQIGQKTIDVLTQAMSVRFPCLNRLVLRDCQVSDVLCVDKLREAITCRNTKGAYKFTLYCEPALTQQMLPDFPKDSIQSLSAIKLENVFPSYSAVRKTSVENLVAAGLFMDATASPLLSSLPSPFENESILSRKRALTA